jgi:undecaprenyl-diphosphatase
MLALRTATDPADPIGPLWVEEMARDLTSLGSVTVLTLVSVAITGFLILRRRHGAAALVLTAVFGGMLLSTLLKAGFERPTSMFRPTCPNYQSCYPLDQSWLAHQ